MAVDRSTLGSISANTRGSIPYIHRIQCRSLLASIYAVEQDRPATDQCAARGWCSDIDIEKIARRYATQDHHRLMDDEGVIAATAPSILAPPMCNRSV